MFTRPELPGKGFFIVGSSGFIGRRLRESLKGVVCAARTELDLRRPDLGPFDLSGVRYGVIAAGATSIAACEDAPEETRRVNVDGVLELARQFAQRDVKTIWFSSDYVFDGARGGYAEDSPLSPLNRYGAQKAEVEQKLPAASGGDFLILRLGKTYGLAPGDGTLLDEMAALLTQGRSLRAAVDQVMNPTWVGDVIRAVHRLSETSSGLVNCCAPESVTRFDLARAMADAVGADRSLVRPISLDDLGERFVRPKNTGLSPSACVSEMGFTSVWDAVKELAGRYAS